LHLVSSTLEGYGRGTIGVNKYAPDLSNPQGVNKASGIGLEHGGEGLGEYFELKSIVP
jgi:acyl-CoA reductase-like NAD-dependent aldehyde dehydrogenase